MAMGYIVIDVLLSSCALDLHIGFAYVCGSAYDCGCMVDGSGARYYKHKLIIILIKLELLSGHAYMYNIKNMYLKILYKN